MIQGIDVWNDNSVRKPKEPLSIQEVGYFGKLLKKSKKTLGGDDLLYLGVIDSVVRDNMVIKEKVVKKSYTDFRKYNLIMNMVCEIMILTPDQIRRKRRFENIVTARKLIVFFTRFVTQIPLQKIAKLLLDGDKYDHSTIINATKAAYSHILSNDRVFMIYFNDIKSRLNEQYGIEVNLESENPPIWFKNMKKLIHKMNHE